MIRRDFIRLATKLLPLWQEQDRLWRSQYLFLAHEIETHLQEIKACEYRLNQSIKRGWENAQANLQDEVILANRRLRITLQDREDDFRLDPPRQVHLGDLYADLAQLQEEFAQVTIDWKRCILSAQTEPIVLEGIHLGAFAIQFHWRILPRHEEEPVWSIVSLQPNASKVNPAVTHPHVNGEELCAGDAAFPMMKALRDGRLAEAFLLANAVLTHYNRGSAYVSLAEWNGVECHDCGTVIDDGSCTHCAGCRRDFCNACSGSCTCCHIDRCLGCLTSCELCEESCCTACLIRSPVSEQWYCRHCLEECAGCGAQVAPDEIDDDSGLCTHCQERVTAEEPGQLPLVEQSNT